MGDRSVALDSMLTGKRFILRTATAAIGGSSNKAVATTVPAGTVIKVISASARKEPMVEVLIEGRRMLMFAIRRE